MAVMPLNFGPIVHATFVDRPNRFLVHCRLEDGALVPAFMPNPGRMGELLLPGVRLHLTHNPAGAQRKTQYTCMAVDRDGAPVFLHTHANNRVAAHLLRHGLVPGLEHVEVLRPEVQVGHSRFDFLLREEGNKVLAEVKSVTLFHNRVAMFPDAVTERGRRHLLELAAIGRDNPAARPIVLFLVHSLDVRWFMPDYHTDLAFSRTFLEVRGHLRIVPVSIGWTDGLALRGAPRTLTVPIAHIDAQARDHGHLVTVLHCGRGRNVAGVGVLTAGYHIHVDEAAAGLARRMQRLSARRARPETDAERAAAAADSVRVFPVRALRSRFRSLTARLRRAYVPHTGAGPGWFFSESDPGRDQAFQEALLNARMRAPA